MFLTIKSTTFFLIREEREEFIRNKYVKKLYRHISPLYGDPVALGEVRICAKVRMTFINVTYVCCWLKQSSSHTNGKKTAVLLSEELAYVIEI